MKRNGPQLCARVLLWFESAHASSRPFAVRLRAFQARADILERSNEAFDFDRRPPAVAPYVHVHTPVLCCDLVYRLPRIAPSTASPRFMSVSKDAASQAHSCG